MALIKVNDELHINPELVASMELDRRHYFNGPGDAVLTVRMFDGNVHRIKHGPQYLNGVDVYAVQKTIAEAQGGCRGR